MNLAQTLYVNANEAAEKLADPKLNAHEVTVKSLQLFKEANGDPVDFPEWQMWFTARRVELIHVQTRRNSEFERLATKKTASELAAQAAAAEKKPEAQPAKK